MQVGLGLQCCLKPLKVESLDRLVSYTSNSTIVTFIAEVVENNKIIIITKISVFVVILSIGCWLPRYRRLGLVALRNLARGLRLDVGVIGRVLAVRRHLASS